MSDAIMGTFVNIKTMADGTPRIVLDMQCSLSEVAEMGLVPGVPFALARLTKEAASKSQIQIDEPKQKPGELCIMACTFCADYEFQSWVGSFGDPWYETEQSAKQFILEMCGISSRKELDTNPHAAALFHRQIRTPFLDWKRA